MQKDDVLKNELVKKEILSHIDIRTIRKESGFSQEDLAKALGISQSTLSRFERAPETIELQYFIAILSLCMPCFSVLGLATLGLMGLKNNMGKKLLDLFYKKEEE